MARKSGAAETDGEPHNTITPIARRREEKFELDLVLRNNITTEEHPLGGYHPHAELHHIKKENISEAIPAEKLQNFFGVFLHF